MFEAIALTIIVLVSLSMGYVAGLVTGGIHISKYEIVEEVVLPEKEMEPAESSANLKLNQVDYVDFAQQTNGRIDY